MNEKFMPWEDDELIFSDGDWEIRRADTHGLYCYSIGGIEAACAVDGVQLVEWHMAEPVTYSLLKPWENSGIEYISEVDILRDFIDAESCDAEDRKYIVPASSGKGFLRVNKYYLVKNGLASGNSSFAAKVALKKVKSNKYNKACKPWVTDDILIANVPDNVKIERGSAEGKYRVKRGGMILNWTAERLVEEGYALNALEIKLNELCESEKISLSQIKEETRGFWLYDYPNTVKTLRDIAKLWCELEKGYGSPLAEKIMSHNRDLFVACDKRREKLNVFVSESTDFDSDLRKLNEAVADMENCLTPLLPFANKAINDNCDGYSSLKIKYESACDVVKNMCKDFLERLSAIELKVDEFVVYDGPETDADYSEEIKAVDAFPIKILPANLQALLKDEYETIMSFKDEYDSACDSIKEKLGVYKTAIQKADPKLAEAEQAFVSIEKNMQAIEERRKQLDGVLQMLGSAVRKKPSLFAKKKDKESHIRFVTAVKIVREGFGKYTVYDKFGTVHVTAAELIYMKLAEYDY